MSAIDHASISSSSPAARPLASAAERPPRALRAAQIVSIVLALPMAIGGVVFAVIAPDHHHAAWMTWTLAPVAFGIGVGLLWTAPRVARPDGSGRVNLIRLLSLAAGFSVLKLIAFHEGASAPFLVLALVALALVLSTPDLNRKS